jgi:hypothetical protein
MIFKDLEQRDKREFFRFISQLAILAGYEMSEQSYAQYNTVVLEFLEDSGLLADFQALADEARGAGYLGKGGN